MPDGLYAFGGAIVGTLVTQFGTFMLARRTDERAAKANRRALRTQLSTLAAHASLIADNPFYNAISRLEAQVAKNDPTAASLSVSETLIKDVALVYGRAQQTVELLRAYMAEYDGETHGDDLRNPSMKAQNIFNTMTSTAKKLAEELMRVEASIKEPRTLWDYIKI